MPANPIPYSSYKKFKYKLEENSKVYSERNIMLFLIVIGIGYRNQDIVDLTIGDIREALKNGSFLIQDKK